MLHRLSEAAEGQDPRWARTTVTIIKRTAPSMFAKQSSKMLAKHNQYIKKKNNTTNKTKKQPLNQTITRAWLCREPPQNITSEEKTFLVRHSLTHQPCQWWYFKCQHYILLLIKACRGEEAITYTGTVISKEGMCKAIAIWIKITWLSVISQERLLFILKDFYFKNSENTVIKNQYKMWKIEDRPRMLKTLIKKK